MPWGASVGPFVLASDSGPTLRSPDGRRTLQVYFNDAGAMHSGNHWTWVVEDLWLAGPRVVSEGYLGPAIRRGEEPVPLAWANDNRFGIAFAPSRHD